MESIQRIILFGARARGDAGERSDIDLAVYAPDIGIMEWDAIHQRLTEHAKTLLAMDVVWLQHASASLKRHIARDGVVLFERRKNTGVDEKPEPGVG
jgi:predicted nucleotidyltransferase